MSATTLYQWVGISFSSSMMRVWLISCLLEYCFWMVRKVLAARSAYDFAGENDQVDKAAGLACRGCAFGCKYAAIWSSLEAFACTEVCAKYGIPNTVYI
jgi:hypothetical protein